KPRPLYGKAKEVLEPYTRRFILQEVGVTCPENSTKTFSSQHLAHLPLGDLLLKRREVSVRNLSEVKTYHSWCFSPTLQSMKKLHQFDMVCS
ncbi:unnamed protein product, partial [Bubo scandiacus]